MEPTNWQIWVIVLLQVLTLCAWLFKEVFLNKPKEESTALAKTVSNLQQVHDELKEDHHELKYEFIRVTTDLSGQVNNLANSVKELSNTIKAGIMGIHPVGLTGPRNVKR